jgi:predicted nuclease of predicted toxin-antitoxin system
VRLLVDESLAARVATRLREAGHDAIHVGDLGLLGAEDEAVMSAAADQGRVVIAADTDFGALLALGHLRSPSVVVLRRSPHDPDAQAGLLAFALNQLEAALQEGAAVSLSSHEARIRRLPIGG